MSGAVESAEAYVAAIRASRLSIYDPIEVGSQEYIPSPELELLLDNGLRGFSTEGLALRTRSKVVKSKVCELLGYPVPRSFLKTQPRFPGQNFDTYIQKANNLQIWNEAISATRRYVVIRETNAVLSRVRVVTGDSLAALDTTGTLTQKYQASLKTGTATSELISATDTASMIPLLGNDSLVDFSESPTSYPESGKLLPIGSIFGRLRGLVGETFPDRGRDQERNRGGDLHRLVCAQLGYKLYADDGRFPDIKHQLLEIKLQTSPTIDLGLVTPASTEPLDVPNVAGVQVRHCDVRYAVFDAVIDGGTVQLRRFFLTTGEAFFSRFEQFKGKVLNAKLQIPLPHNFFDAESLADVVL